MEFLKGRSFQPNAAEHQTAAAELQQLLGHLHVEMEAREMTGLLGSVGWSGQRAGHGSAALTARKGKDEARGLSRRSLSSASLLHSDPLNQGGTCVFCRPTTDSTEYCPLNSHSQVRPLF